jgi:hypothetical protein
MASVTASDTADLVGALVQVGFYVLFYGSLGSIVLWVTWKEYARRRTLKRGRDLSRFAEALEGEVVRTGHEFPFVRFQRRGLRGFFLKWVMGSSDLIVSGFEICAGSEAFLEASARSSRRALTRFPRAIELTGPPGFRLVTTDAPWARQLMERQLARLLQQLQSLAGAPVRVQFTPARIRLEVERAVEPHQAEPLLAGLDSLLDLLGAGIDPRGVRILSTAFDPSKGRCPVCGQTAGAEPVLCPACSAPHHGDCWGYFGSCGVFGCGRRRPA